MKMSGECEKCGEHALECRCEPPNIYYEDWELETNKETEQLLKDLEKFLNNR
jgi:hypothetical protein